jgi:hypothetical protein
MRTAGSARLAAAIAAGACALGAPLLAHKPITSKYTYNADVYPIVQARCGACHVAGGAAPMSLLEYKQAVPWAESIREELVDEKMPPWFVDPFGPAVKGPHAITPRELDTILTWATGGTPEGDAAKRPAPTAAPETWPAGPPDAVIEMPASHTIPETVREERSEFQLDPHISSPRLLRGIDLQPGTPSIVRDATVSIPGGAVLAVWEPGEPVAMAPRGAAFELPAGARLTLRVHYRKSWEDERTAKADRTRVGLYFADSGRPIHALAASESTAGAASVVAVRVRLDQAYAALDVQAVAPDGTRRTLLKLDRPRPEWPRRYWLATPIALPANARIEVTTTPAASDPDERPAPPAGPLDVAVELIRSALP